MKQLHNILIKISFVSGLAGALVASGCASAKTKTQATQALVCPQCKAVLVMVDKPLMTTIWGSEDFAYPSAWPPPLEQEQQVQHSCPGCQGAITTFFKEGKLMHKCSICEREGFSCPVSHH